MSTRDASVAEAHACVLRTGASVLSIDVFDTLLWRAVPEPVDAFRLIGQAQDAAGHLTMPAEGFAALRADAEAAARRRGLRECGSSEVSLEEVYAELPPGAVGACLPEALAEVEVEVEISLTFPDLAVAGLARSLARDHGVRIVLVSNTYFSSTQLRRLLRHDSLAELGAEAVFTSSEHRVHKGSGLYDVVLSTLGARGKDVVHLGDDAAADVAAAQRAGLHAVLLPRRPAPLPEVLAKEGVTGGDPVSRRRAPLSGGAHDGGLTAIRAKALRRDDAPAGNGRERICWETGAGVLGPVFTGFAEWVRDRSAARADEVFCLMREGAFLARLLDATVGPRVATLWTSRYVCAQAAVVEVSAPELETFLSRRRVPTVAAAAAGLGLHPAQLGAVGVHSDGRLDDPQLRRGFLDVLTREGELRALVAEHCARVRRRLVRHVVEVAGRDEGDLLLVDVGWGASIQALLDRALRAENIGLQTRGLYLMTNDAATGRVLSGVAAEGYLGNLGAPEPLVRWVTRSPEVLEQVCMPSLGSLRGFDDEGAPVTAPDVVPGAQQVERRAVQDGILAFQDEWRRYRPVLGAGQSVLREQRAMLQTILLRFVVDPTVDEAEVLGRWEHDENQGSDDAETVLSGFPPERLSYLTPTQLLDLPMTRLYWPFALAALHNPPLARAAAAVALGELPAEVFTSGEDTKATLYVDYGCGLLPRRQAVMHTNSRGLSYLRFAVDSLPMHAVAVGFPPGPGLVRLDWMRLRFNVRGRTDDNVVDVRWPAGHESLRYHDGALVAGNILHGAVRAPRVSFRCPDEWAGAAYHVEIEAGFAWWPAAADMPPARDRAGLALDIVRRARPRARALVRLGRVLGDRARGRPGRI